MAEPSDTSDVRTYEIPKVKCPPPPPPAPRHHGHHAWQLTPGEADPLRYARRDLSCAWRLSRTRRCPSWYALWHEQGHTPSQHHAASTVMCHTDALQATNSSAAHTIRHDHCSDDERTRLQLTDIATCRS